MQFVGVIMLHLKQNKHNNQISSSPWSYKLLHISVDVHHNWSETVFGWVCTCYLEWLINKEFNSPDDKYSSQMPRGEANSDWKHSKFDSLHTLNPALKNIAREDAKCWCLSPFHERHTSIDVHSQTPTCNVKRSKACGCNASHFSLFITFPAHVGVNDFFKIYLIS